MKRGIAATVILVIILSLSFFTTKILTAKAEGMVEITKQVYISSRDAQSLKKEWEKQISWFSLFVDHSHLEPIATKIAELEYISDEDRVENYAQIIAELSEISDHISFSLYTVF